jgi:phage baseplate assembly protein gpV
MDKIAKIKKALESFGLKPNLPITAKVVSVQNDTCTVKLESGLVLSDIRLKATIGGGGDYFIVEPKVGSQVIVLSQTGELSGLIVLKVDAIAKVKLKQNGLEIIIDSSDGKVVLKNNTANLHTVFNDLATALLGFAVNTPNGPSTGLMPTTATEITSFKTKINQLLKAS